jgi:4-alpha-glucanotransferase
LEDYKVSKAAQERVGQRDFQTRLASLRAAERVEYEAVAAVKFQVLQVVFQDFLNRHRRSAGKTTSRWKQFQSYLEREGDLLDRFALFCALDRVMHEMDPKIWIWRDWPESYQHPDGDAVRRFRETHGEDLLFYKYIQWQLDEQLSAVQAYAVRRGMSLGLYHDLALAIDRFGADAWAYPDYFHPKLRVGAPPDAFAQHGQDWGFAPPNMEKIGEEGYAFFIQEIHKNCRHGGALRIDHVMRLFHLFCIPEEASPGEGAYLSQPHEDLVNLLCLESVRNQVVIIGEDLGTVPEYIRERLNAADILSYRLLYFEKDDRQNFIDPEDYPSLALVTMSTHDLPTLAGFWSCEDIQLREQLGMFENREAVIRTSEERMSDKQRLLQLARAHQMGGLDHVEAHQCENLSGEIHNALVGLLATTPCKLFVLSQEDLFKERQQQNMPGTTNEYPNWSLKMKYSVEELRTDRQAVDYARMYRAWMERTERGR